MCFQSSSTKASSVSSQAKLFSMLGVIDACVVSNCLDSKGLRKRVNMELLPKKNPRCILHRSRYLDEQFALQRIQLLDQMLQDVSLANCPLVVKEPCPATICYNGKMFANIEPSQIKEVKTPRRTRNAPQIASMFGHFVKNRVNVIFPRKPVIHSNTQDV